MNTDTLLAYSALHAAIRKLVDSIDDFCLHPGKDFSRKRCLDAKTLVETILTFRGGSLQSELDQVFSAKSAPGKSAFVQQREKLLPSAFRFLFDAFLSALPVPKLFNGYRLLACDGTDVNLPRNPKDELTSCMANPKAKSYNKLHVNALYDICNAIFLDYSVDYGSQNYEAKALLAFTETPSFPEKSILTADRGYCSPKLLLALQDSAVHFVFRVKDITSSTSVLHPYHLPDGEFDLCIERKLTCKRKKAFSDDSYVILSKKSLPDMEDADYIPVRFRALRFMLPDGSYEALVTNLSPEEFSTDKIKEIYALRWSIESRFRDLKYAIDLVHFHAKKHESILQELHAAMLMFNYCSVICRDVACGSNKTRHQYKANFTQAIGLCYRFFLSGDESVLAKLTRNPSAIRPGRSYPRYLHDTKPSKSFNYRVS